MCAAGGLQVTALRRCASAACRWPACRRGSGATCRISRRSESARVGCARARPPRPPRTPSFFRLRQLHQPRARQPVVQELAVLVEEGRQAPGHDAGRDRGRDSRPCLQAQRGAHDQRRQEPAPGQQVAQPAVRNGTSRPDLRRPGACARSSSPACGRCRVQHGRNRRRSPGTGRPSGRAGTAGAWLLPRDEHVEGDGQHLDRQQQEGFVASIRR